MASRKEGKTRKEQSKPTNPKRGNEDSEFSRIVKDWGAGLWLEHR
jgi:hypothetical protein